MLYEAKDSVMPCQQRPLRFLKDYQILLGVGSTGIDLKMDGY